MIIVVLIFVLYILPIIWLRRIINWHKKYDPSWYKDKFSSEDIRTLLWFAIIPILNWIAVAYSMDERIKVRKKYNIPNPKDKFYRRIAKLLFGMEEEIEINNK